MPVFSAAGRVAELLEKYPPNGFYIPRFRNVNAKTKRADYVRGFGYQGRASRENWARGIKEMAFGADLKDQLFKPGEWRIGMTAFAEMLPYHENRVYLNDSVKDKWGQPTLTMDAEIKENELIMRKDMAASAVEILEAGGAKNVQSYESRYAVGLGIHEMGTARMGRDPKTSVLNAFNQIHTCKNVFVTDGACMTSSACVNPSLTYMALTARAVDHAVKELNKQNL